MPDEYQMFRNNHKNHGNDHLNNRSCSLPYAKDRTAEKLKSKRLRLQQMLHNPR